MSRTAVAVPESFAAPAALLPSPRFHAVNSAADAVSAAMVTVAGELGIARIADLDCELRRAEAQAVLVVVDLRALEFIDSSGGRLLLAAHRRIRRAGGRMLVVRGPAEIEWLFALTGIHRELELVDWPRVTPAFATDSSTPAGVARRPSSSQ